MQRKPFRHVPHPFFAVGFNYHPSATGCHYWQKWDPLRIDQDFQEMKRRGFNTVRFFTFWADFEPVAGHYDTVVTARLQELVQIARNHDLWCIPALLTIWMNGQLFDLPWRRGRDLWTDADMVTHEIKYVQHIASALRDAKNILSYDLGDEVIHVDLACARKLSRSAVKSWQKTLSDAIRQADPDAYMFQGNEASTILGNHEFRPENSQALDLIALHGFPLWAPFAIESVMSYKSTSFVPFLVQYARTDGPVLIDELGSYGTDEAVASAFLRATTHSALANGAVGTLVWCWQDFTSREKPFDTHPNERLVGLLKADGTAKQPMPVFQEFARRAQQEWSQLAIPAAPVGVYIPERGERSAENYLQPQSSSTTAAFYAYLLLKRAHVPFEFTHGPLDNYNLIICPSVEHLTLHELELLARYVAQGGTVYYSSAEYLHGFGGEELFGIQLQDFTLNAQDMAYFTWQGQDYPVHWPQRGTAYTQIAVVKATSAEVLARFPDGSPALTCHTYGDGRAYYLNAPLELQMDEPFRLQQYPWHALYATLAAQAGVQKVIDVDHPDVELNTVHDTGKEYAFLTNHAREQVQIKLTHYREQRTYHLTLEGKGIQVLSWERAMKKSDNEKYLSDYPVVL